jgi:hypothetical protein
VTSLQPNGMTTLHIPRRPWSPDGFEQESLAGISVSTSFKPIRTTHARLREPSDDTNQLDLDLITTGETQWTPTSPPPSAYAPNHSVHSGTRSTDLSVNLNTDVLNTKAAKFPPWSRHWYQNPSPLCNLQHTFSGRTYSSRDSVLPWSLHPS